MQLPKGFCSNVPLNLTALQEKIALLELVTVDITAADITKALHEENVLLSAETIGLGDAPPRCLHSNDRSWLFTNSCIDEWRLLERDGHRTEQFMLLPVFSTLVVIKATLNALDGRLPFLKFHGFERDLNDHDRRGLHLTAMALLQGLLPEGI